MHQQSEQVWEEMTGLAVPELPRASHINPWAACGTDADRTAFVAAIQKISLEITRGSQVLRANGSPIPSLVAMEPLQEQVWRHELEGGWGGDNLAEWKWRIHRHFYHPAMNQ